MNTQAETGERHEKTVRALLVALLRFAVTNDNDDRLAVLAAASQIDKLSAPQGHPRRLPVFPSHQRRTLLSDHRAPFRLCRYVAPRSGADDR